MYIKDLPTNWIGYGPSDVAHIYDQLLGCWVGIVIVWKGALSDSFTMLSWSRNHAVGEDAQKSPLSGNQCHCFR